MKVVESTKKVFEGLPLRGGMDFQPQTRLQPVAYSMKHSLKIWSKSFDVDYLITITEN